MALNGNHVSSSRLTKARLPIQLLVSVCLAVAIFYLALLFSSCSQIKLTSWELRTQQSGTELHILVARGACDDFDSTFVRETHSTVTVSAFIRQGLRSSCVDSIVLEPETVRLNEPLGNRNLLGCNPPGSISISGLQKASDTDCAGSVMRAPAVP